MKCSYEVGILESAAVGGSLKRSFGSSDLGSIKANWVALQETNLSSIDGYVVR